MKMMTILKDQQQGLPILKQGLPSGFSPRRMEATRRGVTAICPSATFLITSFNVSIVLVCSVIVASSSLHFLLLPCIHYNVSINTIDAFLLHLTTTQN